MIILITGGSSGLGESITRKFAGNSTYQVYFTYYKSEANAQKITSDFNNAFAVKCNFNDEADVNNLKEQMTALQPDVLINNAFSGAFIKSYFHKTPSSEFVDEFKSNIVPSIILTQEAINVFRRKKKGKIITILTSALLNVPVTGASVYLANKAYLKQLSKVWASENSKYNITSNTVSPAFMLTGFTKDTDERVVDQITQGHPLKKILTTEEVADTVFFLASASDHMNGTDIVLNAATSIA
jgi:3-oxoacyl-[acyl-carrier protein] reductase